MAQKIKKTGKKEEFPHNSRSFPAENDTSVFRTAAVVIIMILFLANVGFWGMTFWQQEQLKQQATNQLMSEKTKWEGIITKRPDYRDAHYKLAVVSYKLGDVESAKTYLRKALAIDPNFKPALEFKRLLGF